MNHLINEVITNAFANFIEEKEQKGCLCSLKDFRFNQMLIPDYSDEFIQNFYLLRYFPAYLVEYYDIYRTLLKKIPEKRTFRVVSIGCGCALDYCGLELALRDIGSSCSEKVIYSGIDIIRWSHIHDFENPDFRLSFVGSFFDIFVNILNKISKNPIPEL